ncbi:GH25193 [Drosophila grimshawi]|uniref:GH25193 n=2 Tax=Drosophila grimshawi TaxID=7222 RepID=B4JZ72_DROGR|nr:GH25193 [Drosophila grimshawi]
MATYGKVKEWSRSLICRPKDNLTTEAGLRAQRHAMVPSIECESFPNSMSMLIGMEYGRTWLRDRDEFQKKHDSKAQVKFIKNDFEWWLKLRKTNRCTCSL